MTLRDEDAVRAEGMALACERCNRPLPAGKTYVNRPKVCGPCKCREWREKNRQPVEVTCEVCAAPYQIRDVRKAYQRLCPTCRSRKGVQKANAKAIVPESTKVERIRANGLVNMRLRRWGIERPKNCMWCNKPCSTDMHHPNYARPDLVVFLCRGHHMRCHRSRDFEQRVAQIAIVIEKPAESVISERNTSAIPPISPSLPQGAHHAE